MYINKLNIRDGQLKAEQIWAYSQWRRTVLVKGDRMVLKSIRNVFGAYAHICSQFHEKHTAAFKGWHEASFTRFHSITQGRTRENNWMKMTEKWKQRLDKSQPLPRIIEWKSVQGREVKVCKELLLLGGEEERGLRRGQDRLQARELLVKVTDVCWGFNWWQERRFDSFGQQGFPVYALRRRTGLLKREFKLW